MSASNVSERAAYLFVYGTLMSRARGPMGADPRAHLSLNGILLGAATVAGRLVNLGTYPGLLEATAPSDIVHGELFRLDRPEDVIGWLDAYEGVSPLPTPDDEYSRVLTLVRRASGEEVTAWIYRYRGDLTHAHPIPTGRWEG